MSLQVVRLPGGPLVQMLLMDHLPKEPEGRLSGDLEPKVGKQERIDAACFLSRGLACSSNQSLNVWFHSTLPVASPAGTCSESSAISIIERTEDSPAIE